MRTIRANNKGFTLAVSMLFLFLIVASVSVYLLSATSGFALTKKVCDTKRAYYLADAGLADAFMQLRGNASPPSSFTVTNNSVSLGSDTGSYSVQVSGTGSPWATYTLTSTGTYKGATKKLTLRVQQTAISSFAYLSNTEIHPVYGSLWWITGMTTVGPVRSNGTLNIWGSPVFNGTTTQTGSSVHYYNGGPPIDDPDYVYGLTLSAPTVSLPTNSMLSAISSAANSSGIKLTGNSTVTFNANGTINVTNAAKSWSNTNMALPSNGTIYVESGSVTVKGTINGRATVASDTQVYISGSLVYNTDPRTNPSSTDLLGLVSKNDVTVLAASAPAALELDAVLVALNGSFQVDQWWVGGKGNMIQYGALINNYCGPTGVFDPSTGILSGGYNQLQYYDTRLTSMVPPSFPAAMDSSGRVLYVKLSFKEG